MDASKRAREGLTPARTPGKPNRRLMAIEKLSEWVYHVQQLGDVYFYTYCCSLFTPCTSLHHLQQQQNSCQPMIGSATKQRRAMTSMVVHMFSSGWFAAAMFGALVISSCCLCARPCLARCAHIRTRLLLYTPVHRRGQQYR